MTLFRRLNEAVCRRNIRPLNKRREKPFPLLTAEMRKLKISYQDQTNMENKAVSK